MVEEVGGSAGTVESSDVDEIVGIVVGISEGVVSAVNISSDRVVEAAEAMTAVKPSEVRLNTIEEESSKEV